MLANSLWLLVLARSTATLALDCRSEPGTGSARTSSRHGRAILSSFSCAHLLVNGVQKLGITWMPAGDYAAIYYILQIPSWQRWDMNWLAWVFPLTQVARR